MTYSARANTAIRNAAFFGLMICLVGLAVYKMIQADAYARLGQSLTSTLGVTSSALLHEMSEHASKEEGEKSIQLVLNTVYANSFPQEQILIREGKRLVAYKRNLGPRQTDLREVPIAGAPSRMDFGDIRLLRRDVPVPPLHTTYSVTVSTWRGDVSNDLHAVLLALGITLPISLFLVAAGGYFLARHTLAPLAEMSSTIDAITSSSLDRRLRIVNARDEVGRLALRFNQLLDRLQSAFAQQRRFMADASHELRTPLAAALTAAQVTLHEQLRSGEEYRQALRLVEEQMLRMRRMVEDMFLLAHADSRGLEAKREPFYLDELVDESCRAMRLLYRKNGVSLAAGETGETPCVGDPGLLRQALLILLDNACKYTPAGGQVSVALTLETGRFVIRVSDTGRGIPPEAQPLVFERFFQADRSRARSSSEAYGSGAGLGLSIAQWIAGIHGGELTLERSSESGSVFSLQIPAPASSSEPLRAMPDAAVPASAGREPEPRARFPRIE